MGNRNRFDLTTRRSTGATPQATDKDGTDMAVLDDAPISQAAHVLRGLGFTRTQLRTLADGTTLEVLRGDDSREIKIFSPASISLD